MQKFNEWLEEAKIAKKEKQAEVSDAPEAEDCSESGDLAQQMLALAKQKYPNARIVTPAQKKAETEELLKKRAEAAKHAPKPVAQPFREKYPLGGYDPISNRSYSD